MDVVYLRTLCYNAKLNRRLEHHTARPLVCMARQSVEPQAALSMSVSQYGYASSEDEQRDTQLQTGIWSGNLAYENIPEDRPVVRNQGASCAWPRACDWPMKDSRTRSEIAQNAMSDAAAAVAVSGGVDWPPEATVYTRNDQVDTDLPPDVELLAFFSDSPISWRPHESEDEEEYYDDADVPSFWDTASRRAAKWWGKMWRYQGLGL